MLTACASTPDQEKFSAALENNNVKVVKKQLAIGMDANASLHENGDTALILAAKSNNWEQAKILLDAGANPYLRNKQNLTALDFVSEQSSSALKAWKQEKINESMDSWKKAEAAIKQNDIAKLEALLKSDTFYWYAGSEPLIITAIGCYDCVQALVSLGFNLSKTDENKLSALMVATYLGDINAVKLLISDKSTLNLKDKDGWTALHFTANESNEGGDKVQAEIARVLIQAGADINAQNNDGDTALNIAAYNNRPLVMQALLAANADTSLADNEGMTPLMTAVNYGKPDLVKLLAKDKKTLNLKNKDGWTALHFTANRSNEGGDKTQAEIAKVLIQAGADINAQNNDGSTALRLAASNNRPLVMQALLAANANTSLASNAGWTPLMTAVNYGKPDLVKLLAKDKKSLNLKNKNGWTALHFTANSSNEGGDKTQAEIAKILIQAGADINAQNNNGSTALRLAASNNRPLVMQALLAANANTSLASNEGWTPLMVAVNDGKLDLVKLLAKDKKTLNLKEENGWTALHLTVNKNNEGGDKTQAEIAKVLIQAGSNVNSLNNELFTPLHLAALNNRLEVAKVLLASKANVRLKSKFDSTAEDLAKEKSNWGIVALLREHSNAKSAVPAQNNSSLFPARPAKRPGVTSCNTRCNNGDCYRTYDDGRQVRFQAQRKYNPISRQWEFDSGSC